MVETAPAGADRGDLARLAAEHYENFPVGSILVPKASRVHFHRVYAFARTADDLADEHRDLGLLLAFRRAFEEHLDAAEVRRLDAVAEPLPLFVDLCLSIRELDLPRELFLALLDAFEQDLRVGRYADDAGLLDYCTRSADPVGRLVLRIFGHRDPALDALSDPICTALQLINHLQDLRSDLVERDRIYFPTADLERFGVGEDDLRAATASPGVRALVAHWLDRSTAMLREGWPLCAQVRGRLRLELRAIVAGAAAVVARIRAVDCDVLGHRVHLTKGERVRSLVGALCSSQLPRALREERR